MITLKSVVTVHGTTAKELYDFMLTCDDKAYNEWWPGTHLRWTITKKCPGGIGNIIYSEQILGGHLDIGGSIIRKLVPPTEMHYQVRRLGMSIPVRFTLRFHQVGDDVRIDHIIEAGFSGLGRILDPVFRAILSERYDAIMDDHVHEEFHRLATLLRRRRALASSPAQPAKSAA